MQQYSVSIAIDDEGLTTIYDAEQFVTIVKSVQQGVNGAIGAASPYAVVWITFLPFEDNTVAWTDNFYPYATTTPLSPGNAIDVVSQSSVPAQPGFTYTFSDGQFAASPGTGTIYQIANQTASPPLSFGLAQQAAVNSVACTGPLNALSVLYNELGTFMPTDSIWIFLSGYADGGVVGGPVPSNALQIVLTAQQPAANVGFNDADNAFYLSVPPAPRRRSP